MATAREKYVAARSNQATMERVNTLLVAESRQILGIARDLQQQEMGGYLRRVVPGLIDRYGTINAAAAMQYYNEQRSIWYRDRVTPDTRSSRTNQRRRADRFAGARLRAELYVAKMPAISALDKAEPIIGWGMKNFAGKGFDSMESEVTNSMTRAVASYNRDVMLYNSALDPDVVRVQRVAEATACGFCRTLAFQSWTTDIRTADYAIDFHNNCKCSIETLYEGDEPIRPEYYDTFEQEYEEASSDREPGQTVIERMNQIARTP